MASERARGRRDGDPSSSSGARRSNEPSPIRTSTSTVRPALQPRTHSELRTAALLPAGASAGRGSGARHPAQSTPIPASTPIGSTSGTPIHSSAVSIAGSRFSSSSSEQAEPEPEPVEVDHEVVEPLPDDLIALKWMRRKVAHVLVQSRHFEYLTSLGESIKQNTKELRQFRLRVLHGCCTDPVMVHYNDSNDFDKQFQVLVTEDRRIICSRLRALHATGQPWHNVFRVEIEKRLNGWNPTLTIPKMTASQRARREAKKERQLDALSHNKKRELERIEGEREKMFSHDKAAQMLSQIQQVEAEKEDRLIQKIEETVKRARDAERERQRVRGAHEARLMGMTVMERALEGPDFEDEDDV